MHTLRSFRIMMMDQPIILRSFNMRPMFGHHITVAYRIHPDYQKIRLLPRTSELSQTVEADNQQVDAYGVELNAN